MKICFAIIEKKCTEKLEILKFGEVILINNPPNCKHNKYKHFVWVSAKLIKNSLRFTLQTSLWNTKKFTEPQSYWPSLAKAIPLASWMLLHLRMFFHNSDPYMNELKSLCINFFNPVLGIINESKTKAHLKLKLWNRALLFKSF